VGERAGGRGAGEAHAPESAVASDVLGATWRVVDPDVVVSIEHALTLP
jgi:hypothetical protein